MYNTNIAFVATLKYFNIELPNIYNACLIILQDYAYNILEAAKNKKQTKRLITEVDRLCTNLVHLIQDKSNELDKIQKTKLLKIEDDNFYRVCFDFYADNIGKDSDEKDLEHVISSATTYYKNALSANVNQL